MLMGFSETLSSSNCSLILHTASSAFKHLNQATFDECQHKLLSICSYVPGSYSFLIDTSKYTCGFRGLGPTWFVKANGLYVGLKDDLKFLCFCELLKFCQAIVIAKPWCSIFLGTDDLQTNVVCSFVNITIFKVL